MATTVAYLQLYKECMAAGGGKLLLPQRMREQLMVAVRSLGNGRADGSEGRDLVAVLEHHLLPFSIQSPSASV